MRAHEFYIFLFIKCCEVCTGGGGCSGRAQKLWSFTNTFFSVTLCKSSPKWCHTFSKDALREVAMGQLSAAKSSAGLGFGVCLPLLGSHFPSWLACHKRHVSSHLFIDCKWFPLHSNPLCMCVCVWRQTVAYCCYWEQAVIHHIYIQGV